MFSGINDLYIAVASTIVKKFSFSDSVVDYVAFLMPENKASVDVNAVFQMVEHFPAAVSTKQFCAREENVLGYKLGSPFAMASVQIESEKSA